MNNGAFSVPLMLRAYNRKNCAGSKVAPRISGECLYILEPQTSVILVRSYYSSVKDSFLYHANDVQNKLTSPCVPGHSCVSICFSFPLYHIKAGSH